MKKVAVFGNAGGGKSTLSKHLAKVTALPLHVLDKIQYKTGGIKIAEEEYKRAHAEIVASDRWVIDGFGSLETLWPRLEAADTLVYIDLPLPIHFWWVSKRFLTGFFAPPDGWPDRAPIFKSSLNSYRALWLCHQYLTPKYRDYMKRAATSKRVYHLRSPREMAQFLVAAKIMSEK